MIGYIYKTTNNITGQFYIGKREYSKDEYSKYIYLGSGKNLLSNISEYGKDNFSKEIIYKCHTREDLFSTEAKYIHKYYNDPLCLNESNGSGYGGIYKTGTCSNCGSTDVVLYKDNVCMKCLLGPQDNFYCNKCDKITYHYKGGKCMSCSAKESHSYKWCDICQKETSHFSNKCKSHSIKLVKTDDGRVEVQVTKGGSGYRTLFRDLTSLKDNSEVIITPRSVVFNLPEGEIQIKHNDKFVDLESIIINKDITKWLKFTYQYDARDSHVRSFTVTPDHPLPIITGEVKHASELSIGDKLVRVSPKGNQWVYGKILNIEEVETKPTHSYDVTTSTHYFNMNSDILSHNCRSFLSPWKDRNGVTKFEGRFNQGVVSLNLPQIGILANKDEDKFWSILDSRLQLCYEALMYRHEQFRGVTSDVSPIHWQYGAIARLKPGEKIWKYMNDCYSTISLGYIGLYEVTVLMKGKSHTSEDGQEFALRVMKKLRSAVDKWKKDTNIGFALYGTPAESLCYKFCEIDKKQFGVIPDVTDKGYYTNSYHVDVRERIDAFSKLKFEEQFQKISSGGCISYVEFPTMYKNVEALEQVIKFIYDNIQYAEFNTKLDYCCDCGYEGELFINDDGNFECPQCHNTDRSHQYVTRRTCGYLGSQEWNDGKMKEFKQRYVHLGDD